MGSSLAVRVGQRIKVRAKAPVRSALRRLGYELVSCAENRSHIVGKVLEQCAISTVLDVGANQGQYGQFLRSLGFAGRILSFEPGADAYSRLQRAASNDASWDVYREALGDECGTQLLHISSNSVSSSLLPVGRVHLAAAPASVAVGTEEVSVRRLDQRLEGLSGRLMLKVDTQGYEMPVLRGAAGLMSSVAVIQAELSLVELYKGQATYLEVLDYLEHLGFSPFALLPGFADRQTGRVLQVDVVACR